MKIENINDMMVMPPCHIVFMGAAGEPGGGGVIDLSGWASLSINKRKGGKIDSNTGANTGEAMSWGIKKQAIVSPQKVEEPFTKFFVGQPQRVLNEFPWFQF